MSRPEAAAPLQQRVVDAMRAHTQGHLDEALAAYQTLLTETPNQPDILYLLGTLHTQMQNWQSAAGTFVSLLTIDPGHAKAFKFLYDISVNQAEKNKTDLVSRYIPANPDMVVLRQIAAKVCETLGDHAAQLSHLEALYKRGSRDENFYYEYGRALKDNGQFDRCLSLTKEALSAYPQSLNLLKLRANAHFWLGQYREALAEGEKILTHDPADHHVRTTMGSIKLLLSDCKEGFEEYAAHRDLEVASSRLKLAATPEWNGEPLKDKSILLWSTQGIGDIIMFAGFVPWLLSQGARVTLAVFEKTMPIFARSFPQAKVILYAPDILSEHKCDYHCSLGQLMPLVLPHYIPSQHPAYLKADAARIETLRKKYQEAAPGKKLIGISWHTTNKETFNHRNIPLLQWQPIFSLPNVQCVSLQYGNHRKEIDEALKKFPGALLVDPDIDAYNDIEALSAQIAAMDAVISIQNSTVHLAGALGIPTTILLSAISEWRWGMSHSDNLWYQSVTVARQQKLLDWQPVLARVSDIF